MNVTTMFRLFHEEKSKFSLGGKLGKCATGIVYTALDTTT